MIARTARLSGTTEIEGIKTKMEIETYLESRQAEQIAVVKDEDHNRIVCRFRLFGRVVQMEQKLATAKSPIIQKQWKNGVSMASPGANRIKTRLEAETRRRWRVLLLRVKLRLDLIFDEEDLAEREEMFREEFMPDIIIPGGGTVREFMEPQIAEAYKTGKAPSLLPGPGAYRLLESSAEKGGAE